jgi:hypothetical protein
MVVCHMIQCWLVICYQCFRAGCCLPVIQEHRGSKLFWHMANKLPNYMVLYVKKTVTIRQTVRLQITHVNDPHYAKGNIFGPTHNVISLPSVSREVCSTCHHILFLFNSVAQSQKYSTLKHHTYFVHILYFILGGLLWCFCIVMPLCCHLRTWNRDYYPVNLHDLFYYFI